MQNLKEQERRGEKSSASEAECDEASGLRHPEKTAATDAVTEMCRATQLAELMASLGAHIGVFDAADGVDLSSLPSQNTV